MSMLTNINVGDKIATAGTEGWSEKPMLKVWEVRAITKTTVRATHGGELRSWSKATGRAVAHGGGEATPYTPELQAWHAARAAAWEDGERKRRAAHELDRARLDAGLAMTKLAFAADSIEKVEAIVAAAKLAAEGGAA